MKKLKLVFYVLLINSMGACARTSIPCESLPESFQSYEHASNQIHNAEFEISESVDTRKSSWIQGLSFLSCDGQQGFLIMKADGKSYIHQNVPMNIWNELKDAESFGSFYNENIKNRYRISIR